MPMPDIKTMLDGARTLLASDTEPQPEEAAPDHQDDERQSCVDETAQDALLNALPNPAVLFDQQSAIVNINKAAKTDFANMRIGVSLRMLFREPEMHELLNDVTTNGKTGSIDFVSRNGTTHVYQVTAAPIDPGLLYLLHFTDISESHRINTMRSDFVANASHELRTPLASVSGFLETLQGPARDDPATRDRFISIMLKQTARMSRLIDDLLSLSRLEMSPAVPSNHSVDLRAIISHVKDTLEPQASGSGIRFEIKTPSTPCIVKGERDELIQVLQNLVENACKYGSSGERVIISVMPSDKQKRVGAQLSVRDFGPGISSQHLPRITERFYRADEDGAIGGTGLGLSIVKHIAARHEATLQVSSSFGEGAEFTLQFPFVS